MKRMLFVIGLLAIGSWILFAGNKPPGGPERKTADDVLLNKNTLDEQRVSHLQDLIRLRASGVPFAVHEIEILDAFEAGLQIASIEADTVISRVIYDAYVAGKTLTGDQRNVLERYRAYNAIHAIDTVLRNAELNADHPQAKGIRAPDNSRDWDLYSDPELFNQLSSAYQNRLERIYGHRGKVRSVARSANSSSENPDAVLVLPNTLVNNPAADSTTQDTQSETALVLGSSNTVISSFNDSGSNVGGAAHFTGIGRSTDGGTSFTDLGALPVSANGDAGDPVLARNNVTGTAILATLGFNSAASLPTFRTTDNGATYQAPIDGDGGGTNNDKEWLACDNFSGVGQGNFYMFYRDFGGGGGMSFTRSLDGGATWSARQLLAAGSGQGAWVTVGADHAVYCFWLAGNVLVFRKSTDLGVTFGAQTTVTTLRTGGTNGDLGLVGGFRTNAFMQVVTSPINASLLFATWNDKGISPSTDKANIYFSQSTNGGTTWSSPIQVNTDGGTFDNWQPCIAITPDGTGLFISWYDRRLDGSNIDVFGRNGDISGTTVLFGGDYRITDTSFPVVIGQDPVINTVYMGDYDSAVADNASYYRTWGDNRLALGSHAHQPDVRFSKIPKATGAGPVILANGSSQTAEGCTPANGVPDPGESLIYNFTLMNAGNLSTTNLVATLQATGGVTSPSGPVSYGAIAPGGSATRSFSFTASGTCGGSITATFQLQDGANNLGTVTFTFPIGTTVTQTFTNSGAITINDNAAAAPYPSTITVSGVSSYSRVTVKLNGMSHTFPEDIDIIVVAPGGQKAYVMSDVGAGTDIVNVTLTFDDNAASALSTGTISSGTFKPSNIDTTTDAMPAPAPAAPYATTFAGFSGLGGAVNGTWSLYVRDDVGQDSGTISGGWSLIFVTPLCSTSCGPVGTPTPTPTPTPSPTPTVNISGTVSYCSNPALGPVPGTTLSLTGSSSGSTVTNGAGNYTLSAFVGGNYTVTPSKATLAAGTTGIDTVDVIAIQRHFLTLGTPLSGCRLIAADVNGINGVDTVDVIAVQRFFLGISTGIANSGKYQFTPTNRTYSGIAGNQTAQNYNALIFGDVTAPFVH